jgi:hypothetical protein
MVDQLIAVFVGVIAEPLIRYIKAKFAPSSSVMLLIAVGVAAAGAAGIVLYQTWQEGGAFTLDRLIALVPTVFAVGQVIYALL